MTKQKVCEDCREACLEGAHEQQRPDENPECPICNPDIEQREN